MRISGCFRNVAGLLLLIKTSTYCAELTMKQAVESAIERSYEMQMEKAEKESKNWEEKNAVAGYLPQVDYNLTWMVMDNETVDRANSGYDEMMESMLPPGEPIPENPNALYTNSFSHKITLNQPITNGGAELVAIRIAKSTQKAVDLQRKVTKATVVSDTRAAYLDWLSAYEMQKAQQSSVEWAQKNLEMVRRRAEAGAMTKADVLQWEAELIDRQSQAIGLQAGVTISHIALYQKMGRERLVPNQEEIPEGFAVFKAQVEELQELSEASVEATPQVQALQAWTQSAEGYKDISKTAFYPKVNAFGEYSWPAYDQFAPNQDLAGWTAGVVVAVPLFSGFRNSTSYKKAVWDYKKTQIQERQTRSMVALNLQAVREQYKAAHLKMKASQKQLDVLEEQILILQKRYEGGMISNLDYLNVASQKDMVQAVYIQSVTECVKLKAQYESMTE